MEDIYDLGRFVNAQAAVYPQVVAELQAGEKRSHWIWFIFPQIKCLGRSPMAELYAIASLAEAQAYARHPLLGPRLDECTRLVNEVEGRTIHQILGNPDNLKFRSSMTLFARAAPANPLFQQALDKYFAGQPDSLTLQLLN